MIDAALANAIERFVDIPDDRTVEDRHPKVAWASHPRLRRCQRK